MKYYADNAISAYRVKLRTPLYLPGKWEVALVEISLPTTWENVDEHHSRFAVNTDGHSWRELGVPQGFYTDNDTFMKHLADLLEQAKPSSSRILQYNKQQRKAYLAVPPLMSIKLYKGIAHILGFKDAAMLHGGETEPRNHFPQHHADVFHNTYTLYVYTDIISPQIVGDGEVSLLRTVDYPNNTSDNRPQVISHTYQDPHYVPVNKTYVDTIKIDIRDSAGNKIPFLTGHSLVKLHFKQVQSAFLS